MPQPQQTQPQTRPTYQYTAADIDTLLRASRIACINDDANKLSYDTKNKIIKAHGRTHYAIRNAKNPTHKNIGIFEDNDFLLKVMLAYANAAVQNSKEKNPFWAFRYTIVIEATNHQFMTLTLDAKHVDTKNAKELAKILRGNQGKKLSLEDLKKNNNNELTYLQGLFANPSLTLIGTSTDVNDKNPVQYLIALKDSANATFGKDNFNTQATIPLDQVEKQDSAVIAVAHANNHFEKGTPLYLNNKKPPQENPTETEVKTFITAECEKHQSVFYSAQAKKHFNNEPSKDEKAKTENMQQLQTVRNIKEVLLKKYGIKAKYDPDKHTWYKVIEISGEKQKIPLCTLTPAEGNNPAKFKLLNWSPASLDAVATWAQAQGMKKVTLTAPTLKKLVLLESFFAERNVAIDCSKNKITKNGGASSASAVPPAQMPNMGKLLDPRNPTMGAGR